MVDSLKFHSQYQKDILQDCNDKLGAQVHSATLHQEKVDDKQESQEDELVIIEINIAIGFNKMVANL